MHLYSPDRPLTASGRPALLGTQYVVPAITVMPAADEFRAEISALLANGHNSFTQFTQLIGLADLEFFFNDYREDPENTLKEWFGWTAAQSAAPITKPMAIAKITIASQEDLL